MNHILKADRVLYSLNKTMKGSDWGVMLFFAGMTLSMIAWAHLTNVWSGIDYPLKNSYTVWIGDLFLAILNFFIIKYYKSIESHVGLGHLKLLKKVGCISLIISVFISSVYHYLFTIDGLYGWCEQGSQGGLSALGYYHLVYFAVELSIILNFIFVIIFFRQVKKGDNNLLLLIICLFAYFLVLSYTMIRFSIINNVYYWMILEVVPLVLFLITWVVFRHKFINKN